MDDSGACDKEQSTDPTDTSTEADARELMQSVTVRSTMLTGIFVLLVMYTLYTAATLFAPLVVGASDHAQHTLDQSTQEGEGGRGAQRRVGPG